MKFVFLGWLVLGLCRGAAAQRPPNPATADTPAPARRGSTFFTLHAGGMLPELHRGGAFATDGFSADAFWSYRGGATLEGFAARRYGLRFELGYVRRGGHETFAAPNGYAVRSTTSLHYAQAAVFPLILKLGSPRLRGFVGAGGYAAYLMGFGQTYRADGSGGFDGGAAFGRRLRRLDYGGALGAGIYRKNSILELRLETGLAPVYQYPDGRAVRNRAVSIIYHL